MLPAQPTHTTAHKHKRTLVHTHIWKQLWAHTTYTHRYAMCTYTCTHTRKTHTYAHARLCIHVHTCKHIMNTHLYKHINKDKTQIHSHALIPVHSQIHMHTEPYRCEHTHAHICMHTHICTPPHANAHMCILTHEQTRMLHTHIHTHTQVQQQETVVAMAFPCTSSHCHGNSVTMTAVGLWLKWVKSIWGKSRQSAREVSEESTGQELQTCSPSSPPPSPNRILVE